MLARICGNDIKKWQQAEAAAKAAVTQSQQTADSLASRDIDSLLVTQDGAVASLKELLEQLKNHVLAAQLGVLAILVILVWQIAPKRLKVVPGPLVGVVVATTVAAAFSLPVSSNNSCGW